MMAVHAYTSTPEWDKHCCCRSAGCAAVQPYNHMSDAHAGRDIQCLQTDGRCCRVVLLRGSTSWHIHTNTGHALTPRLYVTQTSNAVLQQASAIIH